MDSTLRACGYYEGWNQCHDAFMAALQRGEK